MARSQHRLVVLAAEFEESTEWYVFVATPAHWMARQLDVCVATAREWIRRGKALRKLPAVEKAFASQHLSFAKVRALTRLAQPETEVELAELARAVPAGRLGHALAAWTQRREDHEERTARHQQDRSLRDRVEPDGMVVVTVRLAPEDAAATLAAVERMAPEAFLRVLIHDAEGRPINASSRRRHPSVRQKRVIEERGRRRHERERRGQAPPAA